MSSLQGRFKIAYRIFFGFGLVLAILVGTVVFADMAMKEGMVAQDEYIRRTKQAETLLEAKASLIDTRRAVTLFLLKGGQITEIDKALEKLKEEFIKSRDAFRRQERKDRVTKALDALTEYRKGLDYLVKVREDKDEAAKALEVLRAAGQAIQDQIVSLTTDLNADMEKSEKTMDETTEQNEKILEIAGVCSVLLGLVIAFLIGRGITRPIKNMTGTMQELADGNL